MAELFFDDQTPRYAPAEVFIAKGGVCGKAPVLQYKAHPPGNHPKECILIPEVTAVECVTAYGSRWFGCDRAYINSELRMVTVGNSSLDEVRRRWEVCERT